MPRHKITQLSHILPYLLENSSYEGDCLVYNGYRGRHGYGKIQIHKQSYFVHRLSYTLQKGAISSGLYVCHTCDNPPCWLLDHLFLGTQEDNMQDAARKNRVGKGGRHYNSQLTEEEVRIIRQLVTSPYTPYGYMKEVAKMFKVSYQTVTSIKYGKSWTHLKMNNK